MNQQGRLICAKVPSLSHSAVYNEQTPNALWQDYLGYYELPLPDGTGYISQSMLSLPSSHENMVSGLSLDGGLEVVGSISSPDAFKWRDGTNSYLIDSQDDGVGQTGQTQWIKMNGGFPFPTGAVYDEDFEMQGGWSVLCFRASGLPTATSLTPIFDVEVVFHLEGLPPVGSSVLVTAGRMPPVHMGLLNAAVHAASKKPHFKKIIDSVMKNSSAIKGTLDTAARHVGYRDASHMLGDVAMRGGIVAGML